jgi:hypothetical protein
MYIRAYIPSYLCTCIIYIHYLHTFFGIIYVPIYSTCLPTYQRAYVPIVRFIALYLSLNYLPRSSNLLTYLLTYEHTYVATYILHTFVPTYLYYLRNTNGPTYINYPRVYLFTYLHT